MEANVTPTSSSSDGTSSVSDAPVHTGASALTANRLPVESGNSISGTTLLHNLRQLDETHPVEGSYLGILTRNCTATIKMTGHALFKALPSAMYERLMTGSPHTALFRVLATIIGGALYAGSLIACVAIKAVLWIPVILASAVGGAICGAVAWACTLGDKDAAKKGFQFGANALGGLVGSVVGIVAGLTAAIKGPLHGLGLLGNFLLEVKQSGTDAAQDRRNLILSSALLQSVTDSYAMWSNSCDSVIGSMVEFGNFWEKSSDSTDVTKKITPEAKEKAIKEMNILFEIGANIYGTHADGEFVLGSRYMIQHYPILTELGIDRALTRNPKL